MTDLAGWLIGTFAGIITWGGLRAIVFLVERAINKKYQQKGKVK